MRMLRYEHAGAVWSEDCTSLQDWRNRGTITSAPTIARSARGRFTQFDGTDDTISIVSGGISIKSMSMWVYCETTSEEIIDCDGGGGHTLVLNAGTIVAAGWAAPTIYVDGAATTTMGAGAWHHVAITTGTAFTCTSLTIAKVAAAYGQIGIQDIVFHDRALTATEVSQIAADNVFDYDLTEVSRWDMSNINPPDVGFAGNGNDGTGTGLVASTDIVDGPYGGKATKYNGTDERTAFGDVGNIRTISVLVKPDTTTEEVVYIDTGKDIMVSGGTVTYTGVTATATYVDGVATTTMVAGVWQHLVCVINADVDANLLGIAYDGTNFGAISVADFRVYSDVLSNTQAADLTARLRGNR